MEKLLIVDDEEWIVEGLKLQLPWEEMGIELLQTASNGKEAIMILERDEPTMILTDIRMPEIDGLELAKYIWQKKKACKMIIISGYADFEYARKSIVYGVSAYLTKPVIREELLEAILKIKEDLNSERNIRKRMERLTIDERNRELSQRYLRESNDKTNCTENKKYLTCVFYVTKLKHKDNSRERVGDRFLRLAEETEWNRSGGVFFCNRYDLDQYVLISGYQLECDYDSICHELESDFKRLICSLKEHLEIEGVIGISEPCENLNQSFKAYLQAKFVAENMKGSKECRVITVGEFESIYHKAEVDYEEIKKLILAIESGNRKDVNRLYSHMAEIWKKNSDSLIQTRVNIQEIIISFSKLLTQYGGSLYELGHEYADVFGQIWRVDSCDKLIELSEILMEAVTEYIDTLKYQGHESVVKQIKKYMDAHYTEPLLLGEIAKKYYINAAYFSRIFKKEVGINFNDYVRTKRLEEAALLLKSTDLKVYEIAGRAGFENANYFMKKFQEFYGMTPGKYREQ